MITSVRLVNPTTIHSHKYFCLVMRTCGMYLPPEQHSGVQHDINDHSHHAVHRLPRTDLCCNWQFAPSALFVQVQFWDHRSVPSTNSVFCLCFSIGFPVHSSSYGTRISCLTYATRHSDLKIHGVVAAGKASLLSR